MSARWVRETKRGNAAGEAAGAPAPTRLPAPLGQGETLRALLLRARRLELPHALVVEGAPGVGKTTVARWLTAALLCTSDLDPDGPCGMCRTCTRIAADVHPDVHVVDRAADEQDKEENDKSFYVVKVDQIRRAQDTLLRHAHEGRARVLRIDDADRMEEEAQNALLKTLEEPGVATFLLLEAAMPDRLLPTVRSRVQRLRVVPLSAEAIARGIPQFLAPGTAVRPAALALARGSLGTAIELHTERAVQLHDLVAAMLETTKGLRPVATARAVLEGCRERRQEQEAARQFLWLLRSELRARRDALAVAEDGSYPGAPAEPWTSWLELLLAAERDLDLQIPPEQVLVACLLQLQP